MIDRSFEELTWQEVNWQRPFELEAVQEMLVHIASLSIRGPIVWECRGNCERIRYLLGCEKAHGSKIRQSMLPHGNIQFHKCEESTRELVDAASQLKISKPILSLKIDSALSAIRAALAAINQAKPSEEVVLQIVLGPAFTPTPMPHELNDPYASWLSTAFGNVGPASAEGRASVKEKISQHSFSCVLRIGVTAATPAAVGARMTGVLAALRIMESAGVRFTTGSIDPMKLNDPHVPWHFPLKMSVKELANLMLLPVGEEDLPGSQGLHPRLRLPPSWYRSPEGHNDRTFALSMDGRTRLSISPKDSLLQTHIIGPIGSGKSTLMLHQILADIHAGRGVLVIDPKADLVNDILSHIPEHRDKDVVILDPSDPAPVGFNPFSYKESPTLVADAILSVFKEVFSENWGILSQDVMSAALLTLAQVPGASLLWLPQMLTDDVFRKKITSQVSDKIGLDSYWAGFNAMKDGERRKEIAPVLNKLRQFILRPGLRNVLGQSSPKFDLADLFNKKRIVLVPLNKGMIGSESARLLGSLLVSMMWTLTLSRAKVPQERRHPVAVYIDELQDYLSLPTDLSDALAQARGLGVSLTLAHQYREQLPPDIRAGIDANCLNKIVFGLNVADAKAFAGMAPELSPEDFMKLPRYQIYTSFQNNGKSTGWISGQTLPPPEPTRDIFDLRAKSMAAYGKPTEEIEAEYMQQLGHTSEENPLPEQDAPPEPSPAPTPVGRRKKAPNPVAPPDEPPDGSVA
ncbi:MAG: type IV secretion system DNA-binding domain-containing protein [Oscillospiraceae bacterium]|jgi:hypothetical protein|nr:type IV secretion system DNA-binding domain-containing protein [Oscillospiraceae bacterium]